MAATFLLPAAGFPTAPASGRWSRSTKSGQRSGPADLRHSSHRYPHRGAKSAHRAVGERDVAAMRARDVAGDRQPQSGATLVLIAGIVEPQERLEHFLPHFEGNARPVVVNRDRQIAVI